MMTKRFLTRLAPALFAFVFAPLLHAGTAGTHLELNALPSFVARVFVPVVPQTVNTLSIDNLAIEQVLEAPPGFDVRAKNGAVTIAPAAGERSDYARVRAGGRELTLTLVSLGSATRRATRVISTATRWTSTSTRTATAAWTT